MEKVEDFIRRLRWKVFWWERRNEEEEEDQDISEKYGLKTAATPPQSKYLKNFEEDLFNLVKNLEYNNYSNKFLEELDNFRVDMNNSKQMLVKGDKTTNFYRIEREKYVKLLTDNISKDYKKTDNRLSTDIDRKTKAHALDLEIADRMEVLAKRKSFITIKDHKEDFPNSIKCRLINPARNNLGVVSRNILRKAVEEGRRLTGLNLWKGTREVLEWFDKNKKNGRTFIQFDIENYYPAITEELMDKSLDFAKNFYEITDEQMEIIKTCRKSILFDNNGETWTKKGKQFDVSMGSLDSAEVSEIVGLFLLNQMTTRIQEIEPGKIGLYRDDGLMMLKTKSGRAKEQIIKKIHKIFGEQGLKITIASAGHSVDFLDVNMNLENGVHRPYRKPNSRILYIDARSNHPPNIIKNIPKMVEKRLTELSSNEEVFEEAKGDYEKALRESNFGNVDLKYEKEANKPKKRKGRKRKIIWFNPPYARNVVTKIGSKFIGLINRHFPRGTPISKLINRNTVKLSYSCMPNMDSSINGQNKRILEGKKNGERRGEKGGGCNCRDKENCPVGENCLREEVIYEATVKSSEGEKRYIGLAGNTFKERYYGHTHSFRWEDKRQSTELSKYVWSLNDRQVRHTINWRLIDSTDVYDPTKRRCGLCSREKYHILKEEGILNRRSELVAKCRHEREFKVINVK